MYHTNDIVAENPTRIKCSDEQANNEGVSKGTCVLLSGEQHINHSLKVLLVFILAKYKVNYWMCYQDKYTAHFLLRKIYYQIFKVLISY